MNWHGITNEEWHEFQAIPEQGHSHRAWVDGAIRKRLDQLRTDEAVERVARGIAQAHGLTPELWGQYESVARAAITALLGEES